MTTARAIYGLMFITFLLIGYSFARDRQSWPMVLICGVGAAATGASVVRKWRAS